MFLSAFSYFNAESKWLNSFLQLRAMSNVVTVIPLHFPDLVRIYFFVLNVVHCIGPSYNLATVGRRALQVSADNLWNSLPAHLTSATSLTVFRQRLKTFLFRCSYPDLIIWQSELIFCCGPNNNFVIQATLKCHWWWWWQELEKFGRIGLREKDGKEYQRERTARRRERWRRCR